MKMRVAASVVSAAVVALAMTGCQFVTPQQTARSYTPSDGVNGHVGDVAIRNVFLVTADGETASMIGALANSSDSDQTVTLQYSTDSGLETSQVTVPADGLLSLRTDPSAQVATGVTTTSTAVVLEGLDTTAGGLFPVGFSVSGSQPVSLQVPVLNGSLDDYKTLYPTPSLSPVGAATDTAAPSGSASASDDASPSESATP